jgi:hypothetical protein
LFSTLIISLAASINVIEADSKDAIYFSSGVTLFPPLNQTYKSKYLTLNFSIACGFGLRYSLSYDIDGIYEGLLPYVIKNPEELHVVYYGYGAVKLPELSEGSHCLTLSLTVSPSTNHVKPLYVDKVYFSIDSFIDSAPPDIRLLSPENRTYIVADSTKPNVPLNFTSNESLQVSYSLDGQENITLNGNTTLTGLSNGLHNITVYARDIEGNAGTSETITFTIAEPEPEPFPIMLTITASVASVAVVGAGLLTYFKKRKR